MSEPAMQEIRVLFDANGDNSFRAKLTDADGQSLGVSFPKLLFQMREIQSGVHRQGAATIYVADVLPGSPLFDAVQWLGARGGLTDLEPAGEKACGKLIEGQYLDAFPRSFLQVRRITHRISAGTLDLAAAGGNSRGCEGTTCRREIADPWRRCEDAVRHPGRKPQERSPLMKHPAHTVLSTVNDPLKPASIP